MGSYHDEEATRLRSHNSSIGFPLSPGLDEEPLNNGEKTLASDFTAFTTNLRNRDFRRLSRGKYLVTIAGVGLFLLVLSFFPRDDQVFASQAAVQAPVGAQSPQVAEEAVLTTPTPLQQGPKRKALVIASYKEQSMDWLEDVPVE